MSSGSLYYISRKRSRKIPDVFLKKRIILPILLLLLLLVLNLQFFPIVSSLAAIEAERRIETLVAEAIAGEFNGDTGLYADLITLTYKENGSVASLRANTAALLSFRARLLKSILSRIATEENLAVSVPVASLLGINFFPSSPSLQIRLRLSEGINAYFLSRFEEQGINQTRHSILFCLTLDILVLVPSDIERITVSREFLFTETVIVGDVPDAYTKISRLTDDITETEIDDIYDFGASAN